MTLIFSELERGSVDGTCRPGVLFHHTKYSLVYCFRAGGGASAAYYTLACPVPWCPAAVSYSFFL